MFPGATFAGRFRSVEAESVPADSSRWQLGPKAKATEYLIRFRLVAFATTTALLLCVRAAAQVPLETADRLRLHNVAAEPPVLEGRRGSIRNRRIRKRGRYDYASRNRRC